MKPGWLLGAETAIPLPLSALIKCRRGVSDDTRLVAMGNSCTPPPLISTNTTIQCSGVCENRAGCYGQQTPLLVISLGSMQRSVSENTRLVVMGTAPSQYQNNPGGGIRRSQDGCYGQHFPPVCVECGVSVHSPSPRTQGPASRSPTRSKYSSLSHRKLQPDPRSLVAIEFPNTEPIPEHCGLPGPLRSDPVPGLGCRSHVIPGGSGEGRPISPV